MSSKKNIVVVGAGSAGILTAQGLSKALNPAEWSIQLVSNRQFHVHYVAMLRVLITDEGGLAPKALNPLDRVFESGKPGEVVYGEVVSVEDGAVNLDDGKTLSYDYLVIASGTTWEGPLIVPKTVEEKDKWIVDWREKFAKANDIVILGGGAVGTELAGELKHYYPSKHVTLVHAEEFLLNATYPPKFRKTVTANLKSYGVNVILDDKATIPAEPYTSVKTEKGQDVPADLVVPTWGGRRNTDYLQSFDSTILTPQGNVRVLPSLRVPLSNGKTNVYAAGDVIDWDEQKQLAKVPAHAEIVVANILASIQEKPAPKTYKGPAMEVMVLPAGPTKGASYFGILWGLTFGNWVTALIKSKTLFVWLAQQTTSTIFGSVRAFGFTWPAQVISKMSSGYGSPAPSARPVRSSTRKQKLPPGTPTPAAAPSTTAAVSTPQANNYFPQQYYGTPNQAGYPGTPGSYQQPTGAASAPVAALNLSGAGPTSAVPPIPTFHQARVSTYASRMRTGATLLMQPILSASGAGTNAGLSAALTATGRSGRARAAVNYADAASGDEFEDDTEDEDFSQNKKEAAAKRAAKAAAGASGILGGPGAAASTELDQSYLGKKPPEKFISSRVAQPAKHQYYLRDAMEKAGERPELLVPIRVEVDTETHRIRDCFTWNLNEDLITPQAFATTFCNDLDLPLSHVDNIVTMIRAQLEEHSGVVTMDVGPGEDQAAEEPDCRVILRLDVQLDNYHLVDHIEWDLCSSPAIPETTPEAFAKQLCRDLGLRGESVSIISHALHEEILKHKKDAIEWGILGGGGGAVPEDGGYRRNQRGPRRLRGVWRDWMEFRDYGPRMEILTPEELEKKEMERERASRRMRRETSKFQRNTGGGSYRDNRPPRPSRLR